MTRTRTPIYFILLAAFLLRLINVDSRPVWYDEAFAVLYSEKSLESLWYGTVTQVSGVAADVHPLFFYSILHFWMDAVGESAFAVRYLPIIFGVATIALAYRLAGELFGGWVAFVASLLLCLSPFHIAYSQEARMYAQLGFFALLTTLAYVEFVKGRARKWWLLFVLGATATLYSHNLGLLFLSTLGIWILAQAWRNNEFALLRRLFAAGILIFFLWLPWLLLLPSQYGKIQQAYWVGKPDAVALLQTLLAFSVDFDNARLPVLLLPGALFAVVLLLALISLQSWRRGRQDSNLLMVGLLVLWPALLLFLVSQIWAVYVTRGLMPSFLMLSVWVAWALVQLPARAAIIFGVGLAALAVVSLRFYYPYADFPRPPFREALRFIEANSQPGDALVHDNKLTYFPMRFYDRSRPEAFIADPPGAGSDTLALPTQQSLGLFASSIEQSTSGHPRVWFVILREAETESARADNLEWMNSHFKLQGMSSFNDLDIYLYKE